MTRRVFCLFEIAAVVGFHSVCDVVWCVSRRKLKKAVGAACIGGGQGIALLLEAV